VPSIEELEEKVQKLEADVADMRHLIEHLVTNDRRRGLSGMIIGPGSYYQPPIIDAVDSELKDALEEAKKEGLLPEFPAGPGC
jgi:hypothetical protein